MYYDPQYKWMDGAKETILFADGIRNTEVSAVTNNPKTAGLAIGFEIQGGSTGGSVEPITQNTDAGGIATVKLTAPAADSSIAGKTVIQAKMADKPICKTDVYMYKQLVSSKSNKYFDFNEIIPDEKLSFDATSENINTQEKIESLFREKGSCLTNYRYPPELGDNGTLISQIIFDTAKNPEININVAIILTKLQKEQGWLTPKEKQPSPTIFAKAMNCGAPTNIKSQIECAARTLRNRFSEAPIPPVIFPIKPGGTAGEANIGYYDTVDKKPVSVRVKINNKITYALYKFEPWIRNLPEGGANYLFYRLWVQFGF